MRFQPWGLVRLFAAGFLAFRLAAPLAVADEPAAAYIVDPSETRVQAALEKKLAWNFIDTPLSEVAQLMSDALDIEILLDTKALDDFGIDSSTPLTRTIDGVTTRSVLRLTLHELQLTYVIRDAALWITTPEEAESQLITRVYPVGDMVKAPAVVAGVSGFGSRRHPGDAADNDRLIQAIRANITPDTWDAVGGPGAIEGLYRALIVSQTNDVHEQVEAFLVTYREVMAADVEPEGLGVEPWIVGGEHQNYLRRTLGKPVTKMFRDAPLEDALGELAEDLQVPIVIDTPALDDFGIGTDTPVNGRFAEIPLRFALKRLLGPIELTYTLRHDVILVTTPEVDETMLQIGFYPVGNLVRDGSEDPANYDYDSLIQVITSTVAPDTWNEVGGPGAIDVLLPAPALVIAQTHEIHEQITKLLATLETAKKQMPEPEAVDPDAIVLKAYQFSNGFFDSEAVIGIIKRDSKEGTWEQEDVFIESLGVTIVVKHNAQVHARVGKIMRELGLWWRPQVGGGTGFGAGGTAPATDSSKKEEAGQNPGQGLGGFF